MSKRHLAFPFFFFNPAVGALGGTPAWVLRGGGVPATLDIDFVNNQAWNSGQASIASLLTCSRASTGYYTDASGNLTSIAANTLRYGTNGLLVEESRTNLCLQSQAFTNAAWSKQDSSDTVTDNAAAAPDGTTTAASLIEAANTNTHSIFQSSISYVNTTAYSYTVYAKLASGARILQLYPTFTVGGNGGGKFDLTNGTATSVAGTGSCVATITALANGWYRCMLTFTAQTSVSGSVFLTIATSTGDALDTGHAGDGTSGFYLWGAQLEAGAFATSYIPTTGASATRAAEIVSLTTPSIVETVAATFYAQTNQVQDTGSNAVILETTFAGARPFYVAASGQLGTYNASSSQLAFLGSGTFAGPVKSAMAFDGTGRSVCGNNSTVATDAAVMPATTELLFGSQAGGGGIAIDGFITRAAYWPSRLSDATLQALTT